MLIQGVIGGAAITALTVALSDTLAGPVVLVAIAAIVYAIYQHRGEIKGSFKNILKVLSRLEKQLKSIRLVELQKMVER